MTLHVIFAFWFVHGWSHGNAVAATAKDTLEVTGNAFGGGVWFNYLFLLLWNVDGLWWWLNETSYMQRPRWVTGLIYGFLAFIAFNATVVFETGGMRAFGIAATAILIACLVYRRLASRPDK